MIFSRLLSNPANIAMSAIAFACASVSGVALIVHALGWLPMYFLIDILAAPSLILLLAMGVIARRINQPVFLNRLLVGAWGGLAATFAYDLVRLLLWQARIFDFNPFVSHPIFGAMITGYPVESRAAIGVGWSYHFWNGIGFGIMYTLIAGRAHWLYAVTWALFLEVAWLTALPSVLAFRLNGPLIWLSVTGHGAYGAALGVLARKFIRE